MARRKRHLLNDRSSASSHGGTGTRVPARWRLAGLRRTLFALGVVLLALCAAFLFSIESALVLPSGIMNGGGEGANIYDRNGRLLYTLSDPATGKHIHVPLSEIPDGLKEAVIATEDPRFYSNPGFDVLSTMRA